MNTRRIDHVTVATPDAAAAHATFQRLFGFATAPGAGAAVQVGDARVEFVTPAAGTGLADVLAASGEGMAELCLQVASLDDAAQTLDRGGIAYTSDAAAGRRVIRVEPSAAHGVRLSLIERR